MLTSSTQAEPVGFAENPHSAAEDSGLLLTYFVLPQEERFKTYSLNHRRRLGTDKHQRYGPKHLPGMCAVSSWEGLLGSLTCGTG